MIKFLKIAIVTASVVSAGIANAETFNFTSLTPASGGATGFAGCAFNSGNDICGTAMTFAQGLLTATATATYLGSASNGSVSVKVMQDWNGPSAASFVGLGVYHKINDTSDDNITSGEVLKLSFNQVVTLTGLNLRADGHGTNFGSSAPTFMLNGSNHTLTSTVNNLSVTGQYFTFGFGGAHPDQYYLSGMSVTAVPEPETYAMMLAGLGILGGFVRRKAKQA